MKKIVSISLGSSNLDCNFRTKFLGQSFQIVRIGTDQDTRTARKLVREWNSKADAIGLGHGARPLLGGYKLLSATEHPKTGKTGG